MANQIGTVSASSGTVTAITSSGQVCVLQPGDKVFEGDILQTADDSAVQLTLLDGQSFDLGGVSSILLDDLSHDLSTKIASIQDAIEAGADPTQVTDASAAGNRPEDHGHSQVYVNTGATGSMATGFDTAGQLSMQPTVIPDNQQGHVTIGYNTTPTTVINTGNIVVDAAINTAIASQ